MKSEEKHIIWSSYDLDYEDWKDDLEENYPELSEQERITLMYEINGDYLEDERTAFSAYSGYWRPWLVVWAADGIQGDCKWKDQRLPVF